MDEMQIFESKEFGKIRTVEIDGEPYFVGKDVANVLGYQNSSRDINRHVDEEDRQNYRNGTSEINNRGITVINESGLYSLILSSKLPTAKKFKRWITSEVLPAIRKHGAYMTSETLEEAILNPDYLLRVVSALKSETDKRKALEATNASLSVDLEIARPKAEYFDELVDRNTLTNFRETAKQLGVPPKKFVDFLLDHKYIYRDKRGKLMPYEMKNKGLFEIKECFNEKSRWSGTQTLITPKGRETIKQLMIS